jgi:hypothetical protein
MGESISAGAPSKAKSIEIRKPGKVSKWTVPVGAIAAALLVWIGWHEFGRPLGTPTVSAPVQVAQNREVPIPGSDLAAKSPSPEMKLQEKADDSKNTREPKAPAEKDARTQQRNAPASGVVGGTVAGNRAQRAASGFDTGIGSSSAKRLDDKSRDEDRVSPGMAPPVPAAAPQPPAAGAAGAARESAPSAAPPRRSESTVAKGATGGPLVNQANQQANQQINQQANEQTAQNANATLKKEEAEKQKTQTQTVEVSSLAMDGKTLNKAPMSLRDMANITPSVIAAPDNKNAWRVGQGGKIEHSGNGGNSWKPQPSGVKQDLLAGIAPSKKICWVVGKNGTLLLTTDGGKHWARILSPIRGDLGGVHALDEQHASIWGVANHEAYETSDGGATWKSTANE